MQYFRSVCLTLLLFCSMAIGLKAQTPVFVQINSTGAYFGNMSFAEMIVKSAPDFRANWNKTLESLREEIIDELNAQGNEDWVFGHDNKAHYTATFVIDHISSGGTIEGRVVLEYYSPAYHKLFYHTQFRARGKSTQHFTQFPPQAFRRAASEVHSLIIKHLNEDKKIQSKKGYRQRLERMLKDSTLVAWR